MEFRSRFDTWWERVRDKPEVGRVRWLPALLPTPLPSVWDVVLSSSHYPHSYTRGSPTIGHGHQGPLHGF